MSSKPVKTIHEGWMDDPEYARAYFQQDFIQEVEERLLEWMDQRGVSQADLAKQLGKSRSYLSQLFAGSRNMTLRTVADICWALGVKPTFSHGANMGVQLHLSETPARYGSASTGRKKNHNNKGASTRRSRRRRPA